MKIQSILFIIFCFYSCNKKIEKSKNIEKKEIYSEQNDTISKTFYASKTIKDLIINIDTIQNGKLYLSFHENGNLKEKGYQGNISNENVNTGISIGTWYYYDSSKNLDSTIFYNNDEFGKDFIEKKRYFKTGKLITFEKFNNYILYENTMDSLGVWTIYDEQGKVIKSVDYGTYKK